MRIPLTFGADAAGARIRFARFCTQLRDVLLCEGITDAIVVQTGSATTGWSTSATTFKQAWVPHSDATFSIMSIHALAQAMAIDCRVNRRITERGDYVALKTGKSSDLDLRVFAKTPLGTALERFARVWSATLVGTDMTDAVRFAIRLANAPVAGVVVLLPPPHGPIEIGPLPSTPDNDPRSVGGRTFAFSFKHAEPLAGVFARVRMESSWRWLDRQNDEWGPYISASVLPAPHDGRVTMLTDRGTLVVNVSLGIVSTNDMPCTAERASELVETIEWDVRALLGSIGATDLEEVEDYDF